MLSRADFAPKYVGATEPRTFTFDLLEGDSVSSATVTATVWSGVDASPQSIVSTIFASGSDVRVKLTGGTAGVIYQLTCDASTVGGYVYTQQAFLTVLGEA